MKILENRSKMILSPWMFILLIANVEFCKTFDIKILDNDTIVVTKKGKIRGQTEDGMSTFYGIPYALVNVGNPFGATLKSPNFDETFNASNPNIKCPQVVGGEGGIMQCLILNIYVPKFRDVNHKMPVFVWFHGGSFVFGSAGAYNGEQLAKHNIIVVTANYRLGPYGFLCLVHPKIPGNQGLKDQVAALRWVNENIGAFGGNSNEITIGGESYGGGAVDLHLFSKSENLFKRAIIQSGSAQSLWMFTKTDNHVPIKLAEHLGYATNKIGDALRFILKTDPVTVMGAVQNMSLILTACKEKKFEGVENFITEDSFHLYNPDRVKDTSILIGYNSKETFNVFANLPDDAYAIASTVMYNNLKESFNMNENEIKELSRIIHDFYFGNKSITKDAMLELVDLTSDYILLHAAESSVSRYIAQGAKEVYKYLFSYVGGSPFKNIPGVGAFHMEELQYLFGSSRVGNFSDEQYFMRDRMTKMWSNFVKYGNPTPEVTDLLPVPWIPVTGNESRPAMIIDVEMSMRDRVYSQRMAFWDLFWQAHWRKSNVYSGKCDLKCSKF